MTNQIIVCFIQFLLVGLIVWIAWTIFSYAKKYRIDLRERFWTGFGIGFITDLLDTLGIGTFATTTTLFKVTKLVEDDRKIPATMTTAHIIPVLVEALLFVTIVQVDLQTLVAMATAAFLGAFVGARVTQHWDTQKVQRILGILLVIAAFFMVYRMVTNPGADLTDDVHGLSGWKLLVGVIFDFIIGMLMSMGLGNYAPELIFFSLMGISPAIALPVMMVNAAMIMTAGAKQFIKSGRVHWPGVLGIIVGGVFGVLLAAKFLSSLDVNNLKMLVVFIASYTGLSLLSSSFVSPIKEKK
ncbi:MULTISPECIES: sulfite exporter TauE/SafE family protein [unclassified Streptococcus]|uniref:sulfite exporter TauE/SafE family protein n=1 Tax=unclassified Streptococcus TaxID=2608887 RepID=UPI0010728F97|nr:MULTISPECIES: sulfite exporter TauE/SafE family protein [unclassified Streptococcus]MBF0787648.1 sulfite exporter TauE/SafE family protein [Streptococcus sp. 19428wC2_LYSM12]MCQ9212221.1 sulfite exporter TauE/SafE family protein [Streptococcus sp. B01]MCQ9213551.1 sulfite exporter TauE/SafE family protein [Streptococcus sp. O1]TFV05370.1 sulfite exporter TauE/SafE family protein [Streptococcus sp. LYSM12]